ncbi:sensor histidine kinase [Cognataquiflexum rubidum]|uniref:sensor histidine kinase n=1 Tax=Cognataquiflexum rubidum TaxID=2922273 RepID=UPI001F133265|nr:histidine kinase [Cognataquiflexum rubidum]MCH6232476.1 histidine kinase [Cognataquiflexum rubidum]
MTEVQITVLVGLLPVIIAFSFIIFVVYRSKRESEFKRKETELKLDKAEGELIALKAQINPHFIFNSLNSIHHFILNQETSQASNFLIKFSKLIRYVLESSSKKWVSLEEEIESNRTYLELEQLRRKNDFSFFINWKDSQKLDSIFIPPMLIQPFLENAIWHGINENGEIKLEIAKTNKSHLEIQISDNGDGTSSKSSSDLSKFVKKSSMGLHLMEGRFAQLNTLPGVEASFTINKNNGTHVNLVIPFEEE